MMRQKDGAPDSSSHSPQPAGIAYKDSQHNVVDVGDAQLTHYIHRWRNKLSPHLRQSVKNGKKMAAT